VRGVTDPPATVVAQHTLATPPCAFTRRGWRKFLSENRWGADKVPISLGHKLPLPLDLGIRSEGAVGWGRVREYGIAFAIIVGGVLARLALDQVIPDRLPFITFFPTVALVAYFCSRRTTFFALLVCTLAGLYWIEPLGAHAWGYHAIGGAVFALTAGMIVYLVEALQRERRLSQVHEEQLQLINRELTHRISNLFAIATSICQQTIRQGGTGEQIEAAVGARLGALATAQRLLDVTSRKGAEMRALVLQVLEPMAPASDKLVLRGPEIHLPVEATTPFALVLHELATNATKYGAWSTDGCVSVSWQAQDGTLAFTWQEMGGPSVTPPVRQGLGTALIKSAVPRAKIDFDFQPEGAVCRVSLPLE
jgi:two-component sensor histidine kinase